MTEQPKTSTSPHVIYLSAGMRGADRAIKDVIMAGAPMHAYIDPDRHGLDQPKEYTRYDLQGVERCTLLLVILSHENPSMHGVMFEAGFALRKRMIYPETGAPSIWVLDLMKRDSQDPRTPYLDMARCTAHRVFTQVESLVEALSNV